MKLMRKTLLIIIFILIFTLTSCKKIYIIEESKRSDYINEYYLYLSDQKQNFIGIDLRNLDLYATSHLKGFVSYTFYKEKTELDEISRNFIFWMKQNYDPSITVFLVDLDGSIAIDEAKKLKEQGYKKIYVYQSGYDKLIKDNNLIPLVSGLDDCGC